jgi:hypothetical protein
VTLVLAAKAFAASFTFVFLKAWQQLNVVHHQLWWIVPTSMAMAACEVFVIWQAATRGWGWIVIPIGLGSGLGCLASMLLHRKIRRT